MAVVVGSACAALSASATAQTAVPDAAGSTSAANPEKAVPAAGEPVVRIAKKNEQVRVVERFSKVVTLPARIARVDGFDQDVIDVTAIDSRSVRIHARAPGVTTMTLLDEKDQTYSVDVLVVGDVRHLQELLARLFPNAAIEVVEVRESVVLRGWVTQPDQITEIVEIAEQFYPRVLNQMDVGCVQQVMLKVKIMEVQRSKLRQFGVNWDFASPDGYIFSIPGVLNPAGPIGGIVGLNQGPASSFGATTIGFGVLDGDQSFNAFIEALKRENLLKVLAEPNLMTMNGRPANLLAGGEFPILVPNGLGTVGIEYKPFGVRLEAVPIVLNDNRVRVELQSEVSDQDLNNSVELSGFRVPALTQRRANTQVELNFGETLVIAGLITQDRTASTSKVPVLGDIPYVGAAFSRKTYEESETELVIMVTPELAAPMPPGTVPPGGPGLFTDTPTDREFYLYNMIEVPSYGPHCEGQCPPPLPTYDPYQPAGASHVLPPGAMMQGPPPLPPSAYPPGTFQPGTTMPATPPAPSGASNSAVGFPQRNSASRARRPGGVIQTGHTQSAERPGLIEPTRPAGRQ